MEGFFSGNNYYGFIDISLYLCYIGGLLGLLLAVFFPAYFTMRSPKSARSTIAAVGIMALVFLVCYFISGGEVTEKYIGLGVGTETASKLIGASLILLYVFGIGALIIALVAEVLNTIKR